MTTKPSKTREKQKGDKPSSVKPTSQRNPLDFYIRENKTAYKARPFSLYYDDPAHSVRLLQGDCIEILNQARESSVDVIFADPPYFLSNDGVTCYAGKMVSVNKGAWDKSKGMKETHQFNLIWLKACKRVLKPNGLSLSSFV